MPHFCHIIWYRSTLVKCGRDTGWGYWEVGLCRMVSLPELSLRWEPASFSGQIQWLYKFPHMPQLILNILILKCLTSKRRKKEKKKRTKPCAVLLNTLEATLAGRSWNNGGSLPFLHFCDWQQQSHLLHVVSYPSAALPVLFSCWRLVARQEACQTSWGLGLESVLVTFTLCSLSISFH